MSSGWRYLITWMDPSVGHLNGILVRVGGNLNNNFPKSQMPGGLPGGMLKLRFEWYINWHHCKMGTWRKPIIDLSWNIILMNHMTLIFLKVFWIRTNTVNVRGTNSISMNEPKGFNKFKGRVDYCALRWIAWKERVRAHVIRSKQGHIKRCSVFLLSKDCE